MNNHELGNPAPQSPEDFAGQIAVHDQSTGPQSVEVGQGVPTYDPYEAESKRALQAIGADPATATPEQVAAAEAQISAGRSERLAHATDTSARQRRHLGPREL